MSGTEITVYILPTSYKFRLDSAAAVPIYTADNVRSTAAGLTGVSNVADVVISVDTNNDGTNKVSFLNGTSVEKAQIDESGNLQVDGTVTVGDATEADKAVLFDGNAQDFHLGLKDSTDTLLIGRGTVLGTTPAFAVNATGAVSLTGQSGCDVRLTLTSGTAVTVADVTTSTSVYATPYTPRGGPASCTFYDGTAAWWALPITEVTIPLGTLTSGLPYDIFCYNNAGVFACDAPLAWTNGTTRATALASQNGVYVKTGATTRRFMGSFYTISTTETADMATKRLVCNAYNRDRRVLAKQDGAATYQYQTATWRQAHADTAMQVEVLACLTDVNLHLVNAAVINNATADVIAQISIGEDSTTTPIVGVLGGIAQSTSTFGNYLPLLATLDKKPAVGWHRYVPLEISTASGTTNWRLSTTFTVGAMNLAGIQGWVEQ